MRRIPRVERLHPPQRPLPTLGGTAFNRWGATRTRDSLGHNMKTSIQLTVALGVAIVVSQPALADDQLEEVVVTAQKRSERLQDVPIQVDVFTAQSIAEPGNPDNSAFVR